MKKRWIAEIHADTDSIRNMHKGYHELRYLSLSTLAETKQIARKNVEEALLSIPAIVDSIRVYPVPGGIEGVYDRIGAEAVYEILYGEGHNMRYGG